MLTMSCIVERKRVCPAAALWGWSWAEVVVSKKVQILTLLYRFILPKLSWSLRKSRAQVAVPQAAF